MTCFFALITYIFAAFALVSIFKPELFSRKFHKWVQDWAAELGLELRRYRQNGFELSGLRGGVQVTLTWTGSATTVQVDQPGIPSTLKMSESWWRQVIGLETGDHPFDIRVKVEGDDAIAFALLDEKTRELVQQLILQGGRVEDSRVTLSKEDAFWSNSARATYSAKAIDFAVDVSKRLAISGTHLPARLADNATKDRLPGVRRVNLLALERHFPKHSECLLSYRAALADPAPELRVLAADFLLNRPGTELADVNDAAMALTEIADKEYLPVDLRVRTLKSLAHHRIRSKAVRTKTESILEKVLEEKRTELLVAALGCIAVLKLGAFVPRLLALVPEAEAPVAAALARALGQLGDIQAQPALLGLLQSEDPQTQQETAKALGKMGDVEAVESLLELARRAKSPLNEITSDAVRRIQGRLPEAEAGQLSLVAPTELEGALSPAEETPGPGDLSVAEDPPGLERPEK